MSMFTLWQSCFEVIAYSEDYKKVSTKFMFGSSWFVRISTLPLLYLPAPFFWFYLY